MALWYGRYGTIGSLELEGRFRSQVPGSPFQIKRTLLLNRSQSDQVVNHYLHV